MREAVALGVRAHQLVHDVKVIARERLNVVRAHRERDLLDHRVTECLDPSLNLTGAWRGTGRVELDHKVNRAKQIRSLRDDEIHRTAKVGSVLRIHVAQLHLEVRRARVSNIGEVRPSVIEKQCVLRTLIDLQLRRHGASCHKVRNYATACPATSRTPGCTEASLAYVLCR